MFHATLVTIIIKLRKGTLETTRFWLNGVQIDKENIDSIVNRILWVVDSSIGELNVGNTHVIGSILAPDTTISFTGDGSLDGTTIAKSLDGNNTKTELHYTGHLMLV